MKNNILYFIREMNLKGAKFNLYTGIPLHEDAKFIYNGSKLVKVIDRQQIYEPCRYYTLSAKPIGYNMDETDYLPYFAKVTEDLPGSCKGLEPETYERCQLTTQYPGNYLVFQDLKSKKHLKIAMNSHTYEPIN
jgi:hypothetical protein